MRSITEGNKMNRYYSTMRPVIPSGFPKSQEVLEINNFDSRKYVEEIGREAWGYIEYAESITEQEAAEYELLSAEKKTWYCVTPSFDDRGRVTAAITNTCEAVVKPERRFVSTRRKDIYNDWYGSIEEASRAVKEASRAVKEAREA